MPSTISQPVAASLTRAAIFLVVLVWDQFAPDVIHLGLSKIDIGLGKIGLSHVAAAIVGFYFGSRS